ncbi:MAG: hypothetical protein HRU77_01540 [Gammaproteobacteria bacterium]|nr:MAG: hypothetical protein HRU77_01540 [Gammaproteobacteria bacterium]
MKFLLILLILFPSLSHADEYLGQYSVNQFLPAAIANQYGAGSQFDPRSVLNQFGEYGSRYSNQSTNNPNATDAPRLYDSQGNYRGQLSSNQYDPESISNQFGRFGSQFSPESVHNEFGAGNRFDPDSPNNQFGYGLRVYGR